MPTHLANEALLVAEAQGGNDQAFTTLANKYARNVYRVALNITGNQADAEDVLQESFVKAYANLKHFQERSRFYTWLVRIAVNEALMLLRKRRSNQVALDEPIETENDLVPRELDDWDDNPERSFTQMELQQILSKGLRQLDPAYRIVFVLRDIEQLSTEETAKLLELSEPAVKSCLLRGRLKLREYLNRYFRKA